MLDHLNYLWCSAVPAALAANITTPPSRWQLLIAALQVSVPRMVGFVGSAYSTYAWTFPSVDAKTAPVMSEVCQRLQVVGLLPGGAAGDATVASPLTGLGPIIAAWSKEAQTASRVDVHHPDESSVRRELRLDCLRFTILLMCGCVGLCIFISADIQVVPAHTRVLLLLCRRLSCVRHVLREPTSQMLPWMNQLPALQETTGIQPKAHLARISQVLKVCNPQTQQELVAVRQGSFLPWRQALKVLLEVTWAPAHLKVLPGHMPRLRLLTPCRMRVCMRVQWMGHKVTMTLEAMWLRRQAQPLEVVAAWGVRSSGGP